jgi:hypothetical protein
VRRLRALGEEASAPTACEKQEVNLVKVQRSLPAPRGTALMLLVCHSGAGTLLAECLALAVVRLSEYRGWTVSAC